jgi:hypothetical protein
MAATYAVVARRRGRLRAWAIGLVNVAGATLRLAWFAALAAAFRRWRWRRDETRRWLDAHRRALRRGLRDREVVEATDPGPPTPA